MDRHKHESQPGRAVVPGSEKPGIAEASLEIPGFPLIRDRVPRPTVERKDVVAARVPASPSPVLRIANTNTHTADVLARLALDEGTAGVTFKQSHAVLVGDHNRMTVVEHYRPEHTDISMAELERTIDDSWTLRWAATMLTDDPESWLANFLFIMFAPACYHEIAEETRTATAKVGSACIFRDSNGTTVGDHLRANAHFEHHVERFRAPAAMMLRDPGFRRAYFALRHTETPDYDRFEKAARTVLDDFSRSPDPLLGVDVPRPRVTLHSNEIHVLKARGATVGVDSTLRSSHRISFGRLNVAP